MLKRLELVGFKSFAEKTQFDFGPGITAIVGPNGSGKSNVVDAVRWILGEQSAKSLRGGEMADVIFNGSSTRRSLGMAEVTLTLDNRPRHLAIDADEIHVTRRVYRSGEGAYLINKQPARLRDIKELFLGSGAGADAYCIIAQGRVEAMLQSSTRDRRIIFEEAAGISRFKAKKIETLRKLEHVDQHLQRLRDICDEVERQLRQVKLQAAKAQRYQEYAGRLKELRVALSLDEHHQLAQALAAVDAQLASLRQELEVQLKSMAASEEHLRRLDEEIATLDQRARAEDATLAEARQRISAAEATQQHERSLTSTLEQELRQTRDQVQAVARLLASTAAALAAADDELAEVDAACHQEAQSVERREAELRAIHQRLTALRQQAEADKNALFEQMRSVARLHNEQVSLEAQLGSVRQHRQRLQHRTSQASTSLQQLDDEVQQLAAAEEDVQQRLTAFRQQQAEHRRLREEIRLTAETAARRLVALREQRSASGSRIEVLEGLERSREGLGAGARQVLELVAQAESGPWSTVLGLVADMLAVPREYAPLIDLALGDRAQSLLFSKADRLAEALAGRQEKFGSRVTFLPFDPEEHSPALAALIPQHPGLIAPAARLVTCMQPELGGLVDYLLGTTLVVRDLETARAVAAQNRGYRCITQQGELVEADGVLTVGAHHAASGIVSRRSELRELRGQSAALDQQLAEQERQLAELRDRLAHLDGEEEQLHQQMQGLSEQAADLRSRLQQHRQRQLVLAEEVKLDGLEVQQLDAEITRLQQQTAEVVEQARQAKHEEQRLQAALRSAEEETPALELQRQQQQEATTAVRVALAKAEERRTAVRARHQQVRQDCEQRRLEQQRAQEQMRSLLQRLRNNQLTLLRTSAGLAEACLAKEEAEKQGLGLQEELARVRLERQVQLDRTLAGRQRQQALQDHLHGRQLEASDLRHRQESLAARLREEHELELGALYQDYQPPQVPLNQAAFQEEIADLRKRITRLGSVSLDSLQELQELEARAGTLQAQHDDLLRAKQSLEEIISRINEDSRKLFSETLEAIRGHFQELFRKLFGGGMADIVLEDPNDILESGIEIIARPPGKELRSISLLSGGEKTLTAVALLLSIFRSKPSPFCILDEVDAALDEANTGRFAAVLREFLDRSQFIMITHSKKTMVAADVLYGITMQEAGVSKRVAVRVDEWPEAAAA